MINPAKRKRLAKWQKLPICMVIVAFIFIALALIVSPVHAEEVTETNISEIFDYPPVAFDPRPFYGQVSLTQSDPLGEVKFLYSGNITAYGNVSAVCQPEGWDIIFYAVLTLLGIGFVIMIELSFLCLFVLMRLHK